MVVNLIRILWSAFVSFFCNSLWLSHTWTVLFCWRRTRHCFCYGVEERTPSINASMTESLIWVPLMWIIQGYSSQKEILFSCVWWMNRRGFHKCECEKGKTFLSCLKGSSDDSIWLFFRLPIIILYWIRHIREWMHRFTSGVLKGLLCEKGKDLHLRTKWARTKFIDHSHSSLSTKPHVLIVSGIVL